MLEAFQGNTRPVFRLMVDQPASGAWNMSVDEALMESAGVSGAAAVIRLYSFQAPTLSVGRFQPTAGVFDFELMERDNVAFVRRPSGGQAVLHSNELTYSLTIGKHSLHHFGKRSVYRFIVPILLGGLAGLAISGKETAGGTISGDPDCFAATGVYEIDGIDDKKLIGSAQMVSRTSVLQHGSIPLDGANRAITRYIIGGAHGNNSSSLTEELGRMVTLAEAMAVFSKVTMNELGARSSPLTAAERERAEKLLAEQYGRVEWNKKY